MTTDELIARLEGLEGPCRETDAEINRAWFFTVCRETSLCP